MPPSAQPILSRSVAWMAASRGLLHPERCAGGQRCIRTETAGDGDKETDLTEIQPIDGNQRARGADEQPYGVCNHRPHVAPNSLRDEKQRRPQTIKPVNRPHDL